MKIRVLIVDDEPLAREGVATLLAGDPEIEIVGQAADGAAALQAIQSNHPDLVYLDIQMPKLNGFDVLEGVAPNDRPIVVFVTAYDQYAIQAFEACAIDYLLKPFADARFRKTLSRAKEECRKRVTVDLGQQVETLLNYVRGMSGGPAAVRPPVPAVASVPEYAERIVVKSSGDLHFVKTSDVLWIEAQGDFVKVQTAGQQQLVRETLQSMEHKLDASRFIRIHRSFLVNVEHIKRVAPALYGDQTVFMSDGTKLRLSRSFRSRLKAIVGKQT